jgi:hypothetical protein
MEKENAQTKVQPPKSEKPKVENPKAEKPKVQIPTIGRIVHAVVQIHEGAHAELVIRPAMIVRVWPVEGKDVVETTVQAQVFMDGDGGPSNDGTPNVVWKSSLQYDKTGKLPHSWHWPKRD